MFPLIECRSLGVISITGKNPAVEERGGVAKAAMVPVGAPVVDTDARLGVPPKVLPCPLKAAVVYEDKSSDPYIDETSFFLAIPLPLFEDP